MIAPLRRLHRRIWVLLALVLPLLYLLLVLRRPTPPLVEALPPQVSAPTSASGLGGITR